MGFQYAPGQYPKASQSQTRIIAGKKRFGSIKIHDAKLYRLRNNHGRKGQHYTKEQLQRIFTEAMAEGPVPILNTHNYKIGPIGFLKKFWFDDGWLHVGFKIYSKEKMKNDFRYHNLVDQFKRGLLNMVSISVVQKRLGKGNYDPNSLKLNEISVCRKGEHKNCDIRVIEASDSDNKNRVVAGGEVMALEIHTGPADISKEPISVDSVVQFAAENGVSLSEEDMRAVASSAEPLVTASALVMRRMAEKASMTDAQRKQLEEDAQMGRKLRAEKEAAYKAQKEAEVKEMTDFFEAKFKAGSLTDAEYTEAKELIAKFGTVPEAGLMSKMMMTGITEAKAAIAAKEEAEKNATAASSALRAAERRERQTLTLRAATTPVATPAAEKRTAAETQTAKRTKTDEATPEIQTKPENLAQRLAPKMDGNNVVIEADATAGNKPWIDTLFPHALQGTEAQSIESQTMKWLQEELTHPNFVRNASHTVIPVIGKQGCAKTSTEFVWGKGIF